MKTVDIIGYEDYYTICENGTITSKRRFGKRSSGIKLRSFILSQSNSNGYRIASLNKNGENKTFLVHRLLALHFIPNPNNYPYINHINGIKHDNRICNLEWCTAKMNTKHSREVLFNLNVKSCKLLGNIEEEMQQWINIKDGLI